MKYILKHHGILGQKWGKRNGPPYPLDASDHSASEKKAGWRKSLKKAKNAVKTSAGSRSTKAMKRAKRKDLDKMSNSELRKTNERLELERKYSELTKGEISKGKAFAAKVASAVIVAVAIDMGRRYIKSGGKKVVPLV